MLRQPHFDTFRQPIRPRHSATIDTTAILSDRRSRAVVSTLVVRAGLPVLFRASAASCDILVPYRLTRTGLPDSPMPKSEDMRNQAVLPMPPMTIFGNKSSSYHCCYRVDTTPRSYKHETRLVRTFRPCPIQPDYKRDPDSCPICPPSIAHHRIAFRTFGLHFRMA